MVEKTIHEIAEGISVLNYAYDGTNITCIEMDDSLVFVDTGRMYDEITLFRNEMEEKYKKPVSHLLLTHLHFDHYGGMQSFRDSTIICTQSEYPAFAEGLGSYLKLEERVKQVNAWKKEAKEQNMGIPQSRKIHWEYYSSADIFDISYTADEFHLQGEERSIMFNKIGGHTPGSAYVHLPEEKILIAGDNLVVQPADSPFLGYPLAFFRGGITHESVQALEQLEKLDASILIPGHGPCTDHKFLADEHSYLSCVFENMREMISEGKEPASIRTDERISTLMHPDKVYWEPYFETQYRRIAYDEYHIEYQEELK